MALSLRTSDCQARTRRAISLVEVAVSSIILAVMVITALNAMAMATRSHVTQARLDVGLELGQDLMAEIMQAHYEEPEIATSSSILRAGTSIDLTADDNTADVVVFGREDGEDPATRADFDDIDDYDGWSGEPPQTQDGVLLTEYAGYRRQVEVVYVDPLDPSIVRVADTGLKRITVTVRNAQGGGPSLVALRDRGSVLDQTPPEEATMLRNITVELQLGNDGRRLISAAALVNQVTTELTP